MGILEKILREVEGIRKILKEIVGRYNMPVYSDGSKEGKEQNIVKTNLLREQIRETKKELPFSLQVPDLLQLLDTSDVTIYDKLKKREIPGAKKIPGIGWRINRDIFLIWLYGDKYFKNNIKGGDNEQKGD